MRQPLAVVILAGSAFVLAAAAAADRPYQRNGKPGPYADGARAQYYSSPRAEQVCQERARAEDPTGAYAGFPCWAREAFGRGTQGGRVGR
jgi:hypothetical protein